MRCDASRFGCDAFLGFIILLLQSFGDVNSFQWQRWINITGDFLLQIVSSDVSDVGVVILPRLPRILPVRRTGKTPLASAMFDSRLQVEFRNVALRSSFGTMNAGKERDLTRR